MRNAAIYRPGPFPHGGRARFAFVRFANRDIPREDRDHSCEELSRAFVTTRGRGGFARAVEVGGIPVNKLRPRTQEISPGMKYLNLIPST